MTLRALWDEIKSLWPFAIVLAVGIGLHYVPHRVPLHDLIAGGLAEATMIAAILGATVDKLAKKELMRELSVDLWFQFTGRDVPQPVKVFVKRALIETALVATEYELRYSFDLRADGRLDVLVTMKRRIENFSPRRAPLKHHTSIFEREEPCTSSDRVCVPSEVAACR